ncbi:MAG TPA: NAD(P)-dependent oxidoreductase [Solirubrobacteraceae bacterium]|nr:NAD(P)-dependent oxidoreductase [Solirubrobacteraceae bacterium]
MRIFLAGATGVIGRPLLRRLLEASHEVTGTTRSEDRAAAIRAQGAKAAVLDAFDAEAVHGAVRAAAPEVVIHQLTDLPWKLDPRRFEQAIAGTNRLRRETVPTFVDAARAAGARRIVVQSISFVLRPEGPWVQDESAPLAEGGPADAVKAMESVVLGAEGIDGLVLRYGFFYGPGTSYGPGGHLAGEVARRRLPIVGSGEGRFSFVHVDDAVAATVLALDRGETGVYNVVDDEPVPAREWIPALAAAMGAKPPRHVPAWLAKLVVGPVVAQMLTQRGASNAKAKRELGFTPRFPSHREGFPAVFGAG